MSKFLVVATFDTWMTNLASLLGVAEGIVRIGFGVLTGAVLVVIGLLAAGKIKKSRQAYRR